MPRKTEHRTKHRQDRSRWFLLLVLTGLTIFGSLEYWLDSRSAPASVKELATGRGASRDSSAQSPEIPGDAAPLEGAKHAPIARAVYAYSVIPGGVRSVAELKSAMARDPVVAVEYASFRLEDARVIRLDADRSVHVSYRMGDRVFWTARTLKLEKGEALITDGVETARTKCGNMISEGPKEPASPDEPMELTLNTPVDVHYDPGAPESDDRFPQLTPPPSPGPIPTYAPSENGGPGYAGVPPIFFFPQPTRRKPSSLPPPSPPLPPVVNTPEPGTGFQFLMAVPVILLLLWWRARAKRSLEGVRGTR